MKMPKSIGLSRIIADVLFMPDGATRQINKKIPPEEYDLHIKARIYDFVKKGMYAGLIGWNFNKLIELPQVIETYFF